MERLELVSVLKEYAEEVRRQDAVDEQQHDAEHERYLESVPVSVPLKDVEDAVKILERVDDLVISMLDPKSSLLYVLGNLWTLSLVVEDTRREEKAS